jgi:hypothetical protein
MRSGAGLEAGGCGAERVWKLADAERSGCQYFQTLPGLIDITISFLHKLLRNSMKVYYLSFIGQFFWDCFHSESNY